MAYEYLIDVVHRNERAWKRIAGAKELVRIGVPMAVAARYRRVRREFTVKGLARKAREQMN